VHGADRREQELGVGVLEQEAARSPADRAHRRLVEVEGREHDDARLPPAARLRGGEDGARGLDAVHDGHADVHEDDVGQGLLRHPDALDAVARLADELEVGLAGDEHADARAEERLVVDEPDADAVAHAPTAAGSDADTTKLSPLCPARRLPPTREARSVMPARP
jgi:hypothetical protein